MRLPTGSLPPRSRSRRRWLTAAATATAAALAIPVLGSAPAGAATMPAPTAVRSADAPIPDTLFGMHPGGTQSAALPKLGSLRLWDTGTSWGELEPQQGAYNWAPLDAQLDRADTAGISDVLMVLAGTPAWAAAYPSARDYFYPGFASPPRSINYWDSFVREVATRYRGRIHNYQVWNEFNLRNFWSGTPAYMAALTDRAYKIIKEVDPTAIVVAPSTTVRRITNYDPFSRFYPPFLKSLKAYGWPVDVFAVHAYPAGNGTPVTHTQYVQQMQNTLQRYGAPAKPLWETEINFGLAGPGSVPRMSLSSYSQAAWLGQAYLDSLRLGVDRTYWYAWQDESFLGITTYPGTAPTAALADVQAWTVGATWLGCNTSGTVVRCKVQRGNRIQMIAWTTSGSTQIEVPRGTDTTCPASKSCYPSAPGTMIQLTGLPVYLTRG